MNLDEEFKGIIQRMSDTSHGSESWRSAAEFFQTKIRKSKTRMTFLQERLLRAPVHWEDAREELWPDDKAKQDANRFPFLQGDVIRTKLVLSWVAHNGEQLSIFGAQRAEHSLWLVLSPDCDTVRGDFTRVAPIFDTDQMGDRLALAVAFKSPHFFPLPPVEGDPVSLAGRYADLSLLSLLDCREGRAFLPDRVASLTETGWHMLNAQLIHQMSRSEEKDDALKLRKLDSK